MNVMLVVALHELCDEVRHVLIDHAAHGPCFVRLAEALVRLERARGLTPTLDPARFATDPKKCS